MNGEATPFCPLLTREKEKTKLKWGFSCPQQVEKALWLFLGKISDQSWQKAFFYPEFFPHSHLKKGNTEHALRDEFVWSRWALLSSISDAKLHLAHRLDLFQSLCIFKNYSHKTWTTAINNSSKI